MESRDGSGMSPSTASNMQGVSAAFSAILNRGPVPGQGHTSNIHIPMAHPSGLHVPAPLRPVSTSPVNMGNPNPVAPYPGDGLVPHTLPSSVGAGMQMPGSRPEQPQPVKRKRGRPRKYGDGAQGGSVSLALTPLSSSSTTPTEKRRGRPPGSGKKQQLAALGSAGQGFTPHVITIAAGEDVASRIMSFSQTGSRAVCVLSANGAISNVTLRQPATSGGTVTYEGRFEILSLSGSFLLTESGGTRSRTGGLSVSLAGPDGRVVGGGVAGLLMAASPVQVVVGSFTTESKKSTVRPVPATGDQSTATTMQPTASPSPMHAGRNESPKSPESPPSLDQTSGGIGGNMMQSQMHNITAFQSLAWATNQPLGEPRRETDINIPLPGG